MRISISTVGSRGDVEPFVALARGLRERDHQVAVATHERFRDEIEQMGLGFIPIPGDPQAVLTTTPGRRLLTGPGGNLAFARRFLHVLRPWFRDLASVTPTLVDGFDVAVYTPLTFTVWHYAQTCRVPTVMASLQPLHPTRDFSAVATGGIDRSPWLNRLSHSASQQAFWQPLRSQVDRWRRDTLGLPELGIRGPFAHVAAQERQLFGFSPTLVTPPKDWPAGITVTGAWHNDGAKADTETLEEFIAAGSPPVFIGFGSMIDPEPERLIATIRSAARLSGHRIVLGTGWTTFADAGDESLFLLPYTPYGRVFPKMAAIVHHGGAGTTHAALRAGVPQVVVPHFADQGFWAQRLRRIGVATPPLTRRNLDAGGLAHRMSACRVPELRSRASMVGRMVRAETGVENAVAAIEELVTRKSA
ncbi:MAG: glycosyltransferase [Acidimicrobiia bacterium]|nr:glycosyltransferase [Acidimicrobiia bacterium]